MPLFLEYEAVAKRTGLVSGLTNEEINAILDYILSKSSIRENFYLWRPYLKDPKDDLVLEVAVESQSEYIITFIKKDYLKSTELGCGLLTEDPHCIKVLSFSDEFREDFIFWRSQEKIGEGIA